MKDTLSFHITVLYREFLAYTTRELKELGLSFGQLPLIVYVGKHPGCAQAELTRSQELDWGYCQRSIAKLVDGGFMTKEHSGKTACNCLTLTGLGQQAFTKGHTVFDDWDRLKTASLTPEEQETLLSLLTRLNAGGKGSI